MSTKLGETLRGTLELGTRQVEEIIEEFTFPMLGSVLCQHTDDIHRRLSSRAPLAEMVWPCQRMGALSQKSHRASDRLSVFTESHIRNAGPSHSPTS